MTTNAEREDEDRLDAEFRQFTAVVHPGQKPYAWQGRLVRHVAATGTWPDVIAAPTGSGKSRVIDVHVFLQAMTGLGKVDPSTPRRLCLIVDRRALVDSQYKDALRLRQVLAREATSGNPDAVRWMEGLRSRGGQPSSGHLVDKGPGDPFIVANLRGGQVSKDPMMSEWRNRPEMVSVLCFTPDMFGSRLLFSGYGVGTGGRPVEAGLLAYDTVAVIDEAHLNQQLALTCQQIPRIEDHSAAPIGKSPLQTVLTTATPALHRVGAHVIGVEASDLVDDAGLRTRLTSPKPVSILDLPSSDKKSARLADLAMQLRSDVHGTVGVVVNTVKVAGEVSSLLHKKAPDSGIVTVVGRMRPADRMDIEDQHPGLFGPGGDPDVAFVVGTQTLEVGLDMSFNGLVTELASGSALAQRAGRVNRFGLMDQGHIIIGVPDNAELHDKKSAKPYSAEEREAALEWLSSLPDDGLSPWVAADRQNPPPVAEPHRMIFQRIEDWDVENLSTTGDKIYGGERLGSLGPTGVDLWTRDDLSTPADIGIVVRSDLPDLPGQAAQVIDALPILDEEVLQVPIGVAITWLKSIGALPESEEMSPTKMERGTKGRAFVIKPDQPTQELKARSDLSVGCQIVIDESTPAFSGLVFDVEGTDTLSDALDRSITQRNRTVAASADSRGEPVRASALSFAVAIHVERSEGRGQRLVHPPLDVSEDSLLDLANALRLLQSATTIADESGPIRDDEACSDPLGLFTSWLLEEELDASDSLLSQISAALPAGTGLSAYLRDCSATVQFIGSDDLDEEFAIVVASGTSHLSASDPEVATPGHDPVLLNAHQQAVSERAVLIAHTCGIPEFSEDLRVAGLLHDEGKRDPRFQQLLRLGDRRAHKIDEDLAKSRFRSPSRERAFRQSTGLRGWRHEQRSAAVAWSRIPRTDGGKRALITRLVGTTHGHGRASFSDGSQALLSGPVAEHDVVTAAEELFDGGGWETLISETSGRYGFWGVSYLEALLRSADVQISQEGR